MVGCQREEVGLSYEWEIDTELFPLCGMTFILTTRWPLRLLNWD